MPQAPEHTHFGFQEVPLEHKQALVDDVFHSVAGRYDLMNDLMSGGLHRLWKDVLVTAVNPPKTAAAFALLDLAGGTGDFGYSEGGELQCHLAHQLQFVGAERASAKGQGFGHVR